MENLNIVSCLYLINLRLRSGYASGRKKFLYKTSQTDFITTIVRFLWETFSCSTNHRSSGSPQWSRWVWLSHKLPSSGYGEESEIHLKCYQFLLFLPRTQPTAIWILKWIKMHALLQIKMGAIHTTACPNIAFFQTHFLCHTPKYAILSQ